MTAPTLLRATPHRAVPPQLDAAQRAVVEHPGGPLLVLAGPGTGKTTTLVETVVHRVVERGLSPEQVLVLTFSRKAAAELRGRVTARLGRTTRGTLAMTFHSYAFALLRRELGRGVRLLSGPEHDLEVARLLEGELAEGAVRWPADLRPAVGLRGFRQELRDLLLRAQERGVGPERLRALGHAHGRPEWVAAGAFLADYEARFDLEPGADVLDYAGLVRTAAALLEDDDDLRDRERAARALVLVDEVQDTDPAQLRLLQALAGGGRDLVAVGDPDQSIYAFRGADPRGLTGFRDTFRTAGGAPAPVLALSVSRRSGTALLAASRAVAQRLPAGGLPPGFRTLVPADGVPAGRVEVRLAASATAEAAVVADVLRRAHLHDGVAWSDMAVVVRSVARSSGVLRRGLLAAGVPVTVPGDEVQLAQEPVVQALLGALEVALRPQAVDEAAALALLTGPLVRADALAVRRLRRALRDLDHAAGGSAPASELLVEALTDARSVLLLPRHVRGPLDTAHRVLDAVRAAAGGTAEDALWAAWSASRLGDRLERLSARGGPQGAAADRALDAVLALLDAAARYVDRLPGASTLGFADDVAAQEVPADTLAQQAPEGDAVRLLTAHAGKGLQWRVVVVAGVQEGVWPDLRVRGSLLGADELTEVATGRGVAAADAAARRAELLAEERRLFYVAVTRASERLVVTAVAADGAGAGQDRPSRFLEELGLDDAELTARPGAVRPLTTAALVAELRRVAARSDDPALREAACRRLAALAGAQTALDVPSTALADPGRWWGLAPLSDDAPVVGPGETVRVSPSKVEAFDTCALRWFLTSAVGVDTGSGPAQVLGSLVHALAELASGPDALDQAALRGRLDDVLPSLDLGAPWAVVRRRQEALDALDRFVRWAAGNPRRLVGTELDLAVPFGESAVLTGRVDRLEADDQGRAVVVDLKTGTSKPTPAEVERHPQLGVYQLAVELGAFADRGLTVPGGAALLQLRATKTAGEQLQPALSDDADPGWAGELVGRVVEGMGGSTFDATAGDLCSRCDVRSSCPAWPEGQGVVR
ncbi:MAG TPA: ATP-dependent DNA helicase [Mycobacteriales bacterium]|nr:ATP-dependent DNA helicase [Mycobacteriales bacterium]